MTSGIQIFENEEFGGLRVIEGGEPLFVASDVAKALGYRDAEKMTRRLDDDEKGTRSVGTPGGEQRMTVITEAGLYAAILGSKVEGAKRFKRWVTHEVLPSIRSKGGYMVAGRDETPEQIIARALVLAKEALDRKDEQIAEMAPKALFADAVAASDSSILVGDLAKLIKQNGVDIGQRRLFQWMRDEGWLMKSGSSRNMPTQRGMERGLFEVKERTITNPDGSVRITRTTKVTGKGQEFFVNLFLGGD